MAQRAKYPREVWERAVSELEDHKRSRKEVAAEFGVALHVLDYWRRKVLEKRRNQRLVRVKVQGVESSVATRVLAELVFGDVSLRFTDRMPVQYIAELMRHLRGR